MKKLVVQLVTWNGAKYIPLLFDSLARQTYTDWELVVLDNASDDNTLAAIQQEVEDLMSDISVSVSSSKKNLGFAGGHNKLFQERTDFEYVLLLNQDMFLQPDCFARMVEYLDANEHVAAVTPRLMRWDFSTMVSPSTGKVEPIKIHEGLTNIVDALGLEIFRNRRVIEQYTGRDWVTLSAQFTSQELPVFGVSGSFPMYRRLALEYVAFLDGTFLDSDYHSYKEDVDLAFRLVSAGYSSVVLLDSVAHHDRSGAGPEYLTDSAAAGNKKSQSSWVKYHSYKNHLMTLYKNEYWQNWLLDAVFVKWYELKKFGWFLLFDRSVLGGLTEVWKFRRVMKQKRRYISSKRKISWKKLRAWWTYPHAIDLSYGVVLFRTEEKNEVLLIKQQNGDWGFPKGHPEAGETVEQSVRRELEEETGIVEALIDIEVAPSSIYYEYLWNGEMLHKTVKFYRGYSSAEARIDRPEEIHELTWLGIEEAIEQLTHDESRSVLKEMLI